MEALADPVVAEGTSRLTSGEEPGSVLRSADLGLAAAGRDELADQGGQRRGEYDRRGAERYGDGVTVEVDIIDGELADGGDLLCVEDQQQSRDAVRVGRVSSLRRRRASAQRFSLSMVLSGPVHRTVP